MKNIFIAILKALSFIVMIFISHNVIAQYKIEFLTDKSVGEKISFTVNAKGEDSPYVWFDLNDNQIRDSGEEVTNFAIGKNDYNVVSKKITLYGKVTQFGCDGQEITQLDLKNNDLLYDLSCNNNKLKSIDTKNLKNLNFLMCAKNQISSLDLSKNKNLFFLRCEDNNLTYLNVANGKNRDFVSVYGPSNPPFNAKNNPNLKCIHIDEGFYPDGQTGNKSWEKDENTNWNGTDIDCEPQENTPYVGLTIEKDQYVEISLGAKKDDTPIWIKSSGGNVEYFKIGKEIQGFLIKGAGNLPVKIYGDITLFDCQQNEGHIKNIDISNNPILEILWCNDNKLTSLDTRNNTELEQLYCSNNDLITLDISNNKKLKVLWCDNNKLIALDAANGNNKNFIFEGMLHFSPFKAQKNPSLGCIKVDVGFSPSQESNKKWEIDDNSFLNNSVEPCAIPENTSYMTLNSKPNDSIRISIQTNGKNTPVWIETKPGFYDIITLGTNLITLKYKVVDNDKITIYGSVNNLNCSNNFEKLLELDVSHNPSLVGLTCSENSLKALDVSKNDSLEVLSCANNELTELDVNHNLHLRYLDCSYNKLQSLNVANGNNGNFFSYWAIFPACNTVGNPELECIQVDDGFEPEQQLGFNKKWEKDATAVWNNDFKKPCSPPDNMQYIKMDVKKNSLLKFWLIGEYKYSTIWVEKSPDNYEMVVIDDVINELKFTAIANEIKIYGDIQHVTFEDNKSKVLALDLSHNLTLEFLNCGGNDMKNLYLGDNVALKYLYCGYNQFKKLDISDCTGLLSFDCGTNHLTSLDISMIPNLQELYCATNDLTELNIANKNNKDLVFVDATNNPKLRCIKIDENFSPNQHEQWFKDEIASWNGSGFDCSPPTNAPFITLDLENNSDVEFYMKGEVDETPIWVERTSGDFEISYLIKEYSGARYLGVDKITVYGDVVGLDCSGNNSVIKGIDIKNNTDLKEFKCNSNNLTNIDISKNVNLEEISCDNNNLMSLDVSNNKALEILSCSNNQLESIDVSKNVNLEEISCDSNNLMSLDVSNNKALEILSCSNNQIKEINVSKNTNLEQFWCSNNQLESLSVKNGNNTNVTQFNATGNAALECIDIDDGFTPPASWLKDETSGWNNDIFLCDPDATDDLADRETLKAYPNPVTNVVTIELGERSTYKKLQVLTLSGKVLLTQDVQSKLTRVDVSKFPQGIYFVKVGSEVIKIVVN